MPELPEVEMVVRGLRPDVEGRTLTSVAFDWPRQIVGLAPDEFSKRLPGQRVERLWRRAKYIVFTLSRDTMLVHLKMTGRLYVSAPDIAPDKWVHVTFDLSDGNHLHFSDARKFGRVHLLADPAEVFDRLGPEPLEDAFTVEAFATRLARRKGVLKPLLLNQAFVAGIGNIYADEALWQAEIAPKRKADTLTEAEIGRLYAAIRDVLRRGIDNEGATINWYRKPDGTPGEAQDRFNVYDRQDEPCLRCGTAVTKIWLGQRGTHYCTGCQH